MPRQYYAEGVLEVGLWLDFLDLAMLGQILDKETGWGLQLYKVVGSYVAKLVFTIRF